MRDDPWMGGTKAGFPTTRWCLILETRNSGDRRTAFQDLLTAYWKPLYAFVRAKGQNREDAKDAVQGFLLHLMEHEVPAGLDPKKGRFRSWLRAAFSNFLVNLHESRTALKRGGGTTIEPLDFDGAERELMAEATPPDAAFDREWALAIMDRALRRLKHEMEQGRRASSFGAVLSFFGPGEPPSYEEAARKAGLSLSAFKTLLHRTRARFREFLRDEVRDTVAAPDEAEAELGEVLRALGT